MIDPVIDEAAYLDEAVTAIELLGDGSALDSLWRTIFGALARYCLSQQPIRLSDFQRLQEAFRAAADAGGNCANPSPLSGEPDLPERP